MLRDVLEAHVEVKTKTWPTAFMPLEVKGNGKLNKKIKREIKHRMIMIRVS